MIETKNALIQSTMLGIEDHGIMSFSLGLDYGGSNQWAGGYALDAPIQKDGRFHKRVGSAEGMTLIMEVLRIVGVESWEKLKGKHIRVKADHGKVYAIGHLLKEDWLDFEEFWKKQERLAQ